MSFATHISQRNADELSVLMHHTESVDPTLVRWIQHLLDDLLGWGPWTFIVVIGVAIIVVPLWLIFTTLQSRRAADAEVPEEELPAR